MVSKEYFRTVALMFARPGAILLAQAGLFAALGSWTATFPWWPFQMIAANLACFIILVRETRRSGVPLRRVYLRPFDADHGLAAILSRRPRRSRLAAIMADIGLFAAILLTLGVAAYAASGRIDLALQSMAAYDRYGVLPHWAVVLITVFLPLTVPLVEIPWYFGYFFPRLERLGAGRSAKAAAFVAFGLTSAVFSFQHCFQPFLPDGSFLALRFLVELPLIVLAGSVIRLIPRFMPGVLALHGLLAVNVAANYWRLL